MLCCFLSSKACMVNEETQIENVERCVLQYILHSCIKQTFAKSTSGRCMVISVWRMVTTKMQSLCSTF